MRDGDHSPEPSHPLIPTPLLPGPAVTAHHDLYLIARQVRAHLEMLRDLGVTAIPATPSHLKTPWEAHASRLRAQKTDQAAAVLRSPPSAPIPLRAPSSPPAPSAPPPETLALTRRAPSFEAPKASPTPAPSPSGLPLWTTLGARPQSRPGAPSALPPSLLSPQPDLAAAPTPVPPAPERPVHPEDVRLKEAVAARNHVPELRPPGQAQTPSLFDEEPEDLGDDPSRISASLPGFDHTDSLRTKVQALDPQEKLDFLRQCLGDCTACPLHQGRKNIVFGEGNPKADVVFVGGGPEYQEDHQGRPFVGKPGTLLDRMISAMGITRQDVYVTTLVKCRLPEHRDPAPAEILKCSPYLYKQLEAINPRTIVTLGYPATQTLLHSEEPMHTLRGRWQDWRQIPVMPTYHPAFLLRHEQKKRDAWQDLQKVMRVLGFGK